MEQKLGNKINPYIDGVTNDSTKIQDIFAVFWTVIEDMKHGHNAIQCRDWHGNQKQDKEQGKQSVDK